MMSLPLVLRGGTLSSTGSIPFSTPGSESFRTPPTEPPLLPEFEPPPLPGPPIGPPPPAVNPANREVRPGDVLQPNDPFEDTSYRIRARIAATHYGDVFIADVVLAGGAVPSRQQVILKEFRMDNEKTLRLGMTPAEREAKLLRLVNREFDASLIITSRLQRVRAAPSESMTRYFLLTFNRFAVNSPQTGQPIALYLVSNYVPGSLDLREYIGEVLFPMWRSGAVGRYWQTALIIARTLAAGVAALHSAGIVHRDIKPSNTVIFQDPRDPDPKNIATFIIDFGHLCVFSDPLRPLTTDRPEIDREALRCNVPYRSTTDYLDPAVPNYPKNLITPERFNVIKKADVYSMAQTIALMFDTATATFKPRYVGQIERVQPAAPEGMLSLLNAMTADEIVDRPSAAEVVVALERIIDHVDPATTATLIRAARDEPRPLIEFENITSPPSR
jgi:serine/threonine protein kinase